MRSSRKLGLIARQRCATVRSEKSTSRMGVSLLSGYVGPGGAYTLSFSAVRQFTQGMVHYQYDFKFDNLGLLPYNSFRLTALIQRFYCFARRQPQTSLLTDPRRGVVLDVIED